jgi:hypothetical protein
MTSLRTLTFLHTSAVHVARFSSLAAELDPSVPVRHEVNEELLARVVAAGSVTPEARASIQQAVQALARQGAAVILCTCSTIGSVAEGTPVGEGVAVQRVDRAMVEAAIASGRRIVVAAALATTIEPTLALLAEVASRRQQSPRLVPLLCEGAWDLFTQGQQLAYERLLAQRIRGSATPTDVVVLAQASMTDAAAHLHDAGMLVLSSPRLGVRAAIAEFRRRVPD